MSALVSNGVKAVTFGTYSGAAAVNIYFALATDVQGLTNNVTAMLWVEPGTTSGAYNFYSSDMCTVTVTINGVSKSCKCMWALQAEYYQDWSVVGSYSYGGASGSSGGIITRHNQYVTKWTVQNQSNGAATPISWAWSITGGDLGSGNSHSGTYAGIASDLNGNTRTWININGVWTTAAPFVNDNGVWKTGIPSVKS